MMLNNTFDNTPFHLLNREQLRHLVVDLGKSDAEIAQMYGISSNMVNQRRRLMNLVAGQMTSEQHAEVVRLAEQIKHLPLDAIDRIRAVVDEYKDQFWM